MKISHGTQSIILYENRRIIYSKGTGETNYIDLLWLKNNILKIAENFNNQQWIYLADCIDMKPVNSDEANILIELTKELPKYNCIAIGFLEGDSIMLKTQTRIHTRLSNSELYEAHFQNEEEALEWAKQEFNI